jgi:hypothetical protein
MQLTSGTARVDLNPDSHMWNPILPITDEIGPKAPLNEKLPLSSPTTGHPAFGPNSKQATTYELYGGSGSS